jgi:serine phosphatase RsbU (regulator of sigma subunit)/anti-sigma regulatory factor (Ser/Thr protein kinase)
VTPDPSPRIGWRALKEAFARDGTEHAYAGADISAARRLVPLLVALATLLTLAFLPMMPPTEPLGDAGWALAALLVLGQLAIVRRLADRSRPAGFGRLLAVAYLGVAGVALLEWLAGGHSPYMLLFMLWLGAGVGVHPPRRAAAFLAVVLVAGMLPLVYASGDPDTARDVAAASLLWLSMGVVLMLLIATVRAQRLQLRSGEQSAVKRAEEAARRVSSLEQVTDVALAQLPLEDLLSELLMRISTVLDLDAAAIFLTDEDGEALEVRATHGLADEARRRGQARDHEVRVRIGEGCAGRVAEERRAIRLDDIDTTHDLDPLFRSTSIRALLAVPLAVDGRVIGVLQVGSCHARHFSDGDQRLLQLAADRISQAIERTRLNERAHQVAGTLQRALLPDRLPDVPGVAFAARYLPGGAGADVGGDWYDVVPLMDGRVMAVMGDVVGRGIGAAALMGQLRNAFRVYGQEHDEPAVILDRMNALLHQVGPGQMATAVALVFDPASGELCFSAAGHPPPVVRRADGSAAFLANTPSVPLGVLPYGRYRIYQGTLEPGDCVLLYTDGLVEQRGIPLGDGLERLREAVASAAPDDPDALCEQVLGAVLPDGAPADDVALLVLCSTPVAGPHLHLELRSDPDELAGVRHTLERWLDASRVTDHDALRVTLATNEACMNAIEHADGRHQFEVDALIAGEEVDVTVRDRGRWREPTTPAGGAAGGRGLDMMRSFMDEVEVTPGAEGTVVRMRRAVKREPTA